MNKAENVDMFEALLYAAAQNAGKNELNEFQNANIEDLDSKTQDKIYKKLCKAKKQYEQHKTCSPTTKAFKRIAIILLVVMSVGFTCILSIDATREAFWNAVIEWNENFFHFEYDGTTSTDAPTEILEYKEPIVDSRFERHENKKTTTIYSITYEHEYEKVTYRQSTLKLSDIYLSNSDAVLSQTTINGTPAYKSTEIGDGQTYYYLIWNDGTYFYIIFGNIEFEELLKIAESIK